MRRRVAALVGSAALAGAMIFGATGPAQANGNAGSTHTGDGTLLSDECEADSLSLPPGGKLIDSSTYPVFDDQRIYKCTSDYQWVFVEECPAGVEVHIYGPRLILIGGWYLVSATCGPAGA